MRNILFIMLCLSLINCSKNQVPPNSHLVSKYIVFDENLSPELNVCTDDTVVSFREKGTNCMFRLNENIYQIEFRIGLNEDGNMVEFESHSITNDIDYRKFNIEKDTMNPETLNGKDFWIRFTSSNDKIIDGVDTLQITQIFHNEKILFVERKREKKGRRVIYEYK